MPFQLRRSNSDPKVCFEPPPPTKTCPPFAPNCSRICRPRVKAAGRYATAPSSPSSSLDCRFFFFSSLFHSLRYPSLGAKLVHHPRGWWSVVPPREAQQPDTIAHCFVSPPVIIFDVVSSSLLPSKYTLGGVTDVAV